MIETRNATYLSALITGLGNFAVQYNFQNIGIALLMMSQSVCTADDADCKTGDQAAWVHGSSSAVIFIGAISGQLSMGYLGDVMGRSNGLILTVSIAAFSALFSAIIPNGTADDIYASIITIRFFLGVGLGGIFPLSATKASEDNGSAGAGGDHVNPIAAGWTYFWQMPGIIGPFAVALIILDDAHEYSVSYRWRILLGVGAIPLFLCLFGLIIERYQDSYSNTDDRLKLLQSSSHHVSSSQATPFDHPKSAHDDSFAIDPGNLHSVQDNHSPSPDTSSSAPTENLWNSSRYRGYMLASGGTWFLFDIIAFGVTLSGGEIITSISNTDDNVSSTHNLRIIASQQLIANSTGIIGAFVALYLMRYLGVKRLQIYSFLFMGGCSFIMAFLIDYVGNSQEEGLFVMYCFLVFSIQSGVNVTSFALPSALYPREQRSTYNGVASALGKFGAAIGSYTFFYIALASSYGVVMGITCAIAIVGAVISQIYLDNEKIEKSIVMNLPSQPKVTSQHGLADAFSLE